MIDDNARRAFERRVQFFRKPRLGKVLAEPLNMARSLALLAWCRVSGRTVPRRVRTFWGRPMRVHFPEVVSLYLARYGMLDVELTSLLMHVLRPGMTVFDVGGHYGYFSLLAADLVGPQGQVHTFEPSPHTFEVLRANTADVPNVRIHNVALYSEEGELTFHDFGVKFSAYNTLTAGRLEDDVRRRLRPREIKVRARRLDDYVAETGVRPDIVKVDAEGAEPQILAGMTHTLTTVRPMITIEVAPDPTDAPGASARSVRLLEGHGYVAHHWTDGQIRRQEAKGKVSYDFDNLLFIHREAPVDQVIR
jgi:FkbM family methyltransferase